MVHSDCDMDDGILSSCVKQVMQGTMRVTVHSQRLNGKEFISEGIPSSYAQLRGKQPCRARCQAMAARLRPPN